MDIAKLRKHLVAVAAAGARVLAGCSSSPPAAQPSVSFGSGAGGMPGMPGPPSGTGSPAAAAGDQVSIDNFAFAPATLTVKAGTTVMWTNRDEEPHTVAASDGSFHSPGMGTGATYSHTFPTAGTFDYVCSIHPMMHGTVVVTG
ncbi:cupredoxin family copper-binding protein [Mycobacterium sp. E3198]|uniref:cupredoxin domain-containing protein n=1 Tax=Mycobacterium sp. E3198 TaxID=1834143 RepID=UPI000800FD3E|nr:cupredoxin family copper-binding protein [Mycobacterium sp. E3198]OBG29969.1 amidase [Mycobacterium sp. E3198]